MVTTRPQTMDRIVVIDFAIFMFCCARMIETVTVHGAANSYAIYNGINTALTRNSRQNKQCEYIKVDKIGWTDTFATNPTTNPAPDCVHECIDNVLCTGVVIQKDNICKYSTKSAESLKPDKDSQYVRIVFRCPGDFNCSSGKCLNGATCRQLSKTGTGMECICADGWMGWFCDERIYSCRDQLCKNGANCTDSNTPKGGFSCTCPAFTTGIHCETLITNTTSSTLTTTAATNTTTTKKALIAAGVVGGVVVTGLAATAAVGGLGATAGATAGTTVMSTGGGTA